MASTTILLLLLLLLLVTATATSSSPDEERLLLMTFKSSLDDQASSSSLSSWSPSTHHCNWTGVACTPQQSVSSLDLPGLNLSGDISPSLCSLPSLSRLDLARNLFSLPIPLHLSLCPSLLGLNLSSNLLWGPLPDRLPASLTSLDLSSNRLQGHLPPSLLSSSLLLLDLDLSHNPSMSSDLPPELGNLTNLNSLRMQASGLSGRIPDTILALAKLELLDLSNNNLTGTFPAKFGSRLGRLAYLDLSRNNLSGLFPPDLCTGNSLVELSIHENSFTGPVPTTIQQCRTLERFQVQSNAFVGGFPPGLWSLPKIRLIRAENNRFSGRIPGTVAASASLEQVQIDNNDFSGEIPRGLGRIRTMYRFSAPHNGFYGGLPDDFCDSPAMSILNVSYNSLSGPIPELGNCTGLVSLSLAGNSFGGSIPTSLARLRVLTYIDLSSNNLTGEIPEGLQNLKLALFNVSFNRLSGAVPLPLIADLPASFLQGNPALCGPGLPNACSNGGRGRRSNVLTVAAIAFVVGFAVLVLGFFAFCRLYRKDAATTSNGWKSVFFYPLRISEDELIASLDEKSTIGRGPLGNVHLFQLPGGEPVAVKKLMNPGKSSLRTAKAEIRTLAKARHKNLTKVLGFCYSESALLLIHDYHRRGSLGDVLRSSNYMLEWGVRMRIALGTARGLAYLHKDYVPHLLHRNLKSNNVLLDDDFEPKITGFGLHRVVSYHLPVAHELEPRCYIAPEHGYSKKTTEQMDIYSFGVLLLELITGRQAEEQESREAPDVVKWVRRKVNMTNGPLQVLDPKISGSSQQEMLGTLDLALRCTCVIPEKRPASDEVVRSLESLHSVVNPPKIYSGEAPISS